MFFASFNLNEKMFIRFAGMIEEFGVFIDRPNPLEVTDMMRLTERVIEILDMLHF